MSPSPIPPLRGPRPTGAPKLRRRAPRGALPGIGGWPLPRRTMLRVAVGSGTALGFAALGVFPAARRAYADGYDIYRRCPSYALDHDCSPGCGPSMVFSDACATRGAHEGFHKDDGFTWLLRPNQCYARRYDGWLWYHSGPCGSCGCGIEWRCHDGYHRLESGWVKSVCRYATDCGCPGTVSWPRVRRGDTGVNVYTIQHLLTWHFYPTEIDGIFGPRTEARVMEFQDAQGLTVDGIVGPQTWPALAVPIARGDRGDAVMGAQRQLNRYGYGLVVDGIFGPATESATVDFQRDHGLTADGEVGFSTWRSLTGTLP